MTFSTVAVPAVTAALEEGVAAAVACGSHEEAVETLRKIIRRGDTILVKGSRGMKMERILELFR